MHLLISGAEKFIYSFHSSTKTIGNFFPYFLFVSNIIAGWDAFSFKFFDDFKLTLYFRNRT